MILDKLYGGFEVITDIKLTIAGDSYEKKRSLKERFFSRPWRPFKLTYTIVPQVPSREIIRAGNMLIMHPTMVAEIEKAIEANYS